MAKNIKQYLSNQYPDIHVLFVEEEGFSREKLFRILKRRFSTIYVAKDSMTGFQIFQQQHPDLIIADIKLDQGKQVEMIQKIREINDKVQVILTTVHDVSNDPSIKNMMQSANHIILKPFDLDILFNAIQSSICQIQLEKEIKTSLNSLVPITYKMNHLRFYDYLSHVLEQANQFSQTLSLIKIEIDFFNKISDCFGKTAAEKVLNTIITIIQQRISEKDIYEHWKTEEFLLLLPNTNEQEATEIAESLRNLVENFNFGVIGKVTCSIAVTVYENGKSNIDLLNEVDLALSMSKSNGRNQVTTYSKEE
ncbi:diguanylate cyclase (GGDEF)-like protein [Bacillus sp. SORGH_AS 510]|uniref:GGDEF domain-containing response regulator n=1 Tax=Bacillus sp. SORGH_AS_0510 TaxID=3041771 RepID=UPI0027817552|nr:diguanylate cyclase [Bacillus sp. SORGH_AS_0510]MDQ1145875.1 diguanylate cyclase (GGDEF)-like protein [Bacillus sp. SORGH_AS_0510]